jgi:hypothetical protein
MLYIMRTCFSPQVFIYIIYYHSISRPLRCARSLMPPSLARSPQLPQPFRHHRWHPIPILNSGPLRCAPSLCHHRWLVTAVAPNPFATIAGFPFPLFISGRCGVPITLCHHRWLMPPSLAGHRQRPCSSSGDSP